ncbi:hypothetical protein C2E23DRAFT_849362 [Lenzites betulinus]|nr:hypothetical protein C2E23DRAFT_849362 [Lenzites betulinus]
MPSPSPPSSPYECVHSPQGIVHMWHMRVGWPARAVGPERPAARTCSARSSRGSRSPAGGMRILQNVHGGWADGACDAGEYSRIYVWQRFTDNRTCESPSPSQRLHPPPRPRVPQVTAIRLEHVPGGPRCPCSRPRPRPDALGGAPRPAAHKVFANSSDSAARPYICAVNLGTWACVANQPPPTTIHCPPSPFTFARQPRCWARRQHPVPLSRAFSQQYSRVRPAFRPTFRLAFCRYLPPHPPVLPPRWYGFSHFIVCVSQVISTFLRTTIISCTTTLSMTRRLDKTSAM